MRSVPERKSHNLFSQDVATLVYPGFTDLSLLTVQKQFYCSAGKSFPLLLIVFHGLSLPPVSFQKVLVLRIHKISYYCPPIHKQHQVSAGCHETKSYPTFVTMRNVDLELLCLWNFQMRILE